MPNLMQISSSSSSLSSSSTASTQASAPVKRTQTTSLFRTFPFSIPEAQNPKLSTSKKAGSPKFQGDEKAWLLSQVPTRRTGIQETDDRNWHQIATDYNEKFVRKRRMQRTEKELRVLFRSLKVKDRDTDDDDCEEENLENDDEEILENQSESKNGQGEEVDTEEEY